ncbi:hypothetical protein [Saccharothrix luteola]|uniref:hypothetical protein n=1 Tax=Saccharothrix luteola TaxID=2893018 RepID=UPI001E620C01|nr:hypothetical protein [Saccharothrix luteola]MCC8247117.1 hypothetical protein [Saccharothrix luteola]MCC8249842.1 hypothetical protein [Saccharothrix luteola]
MIGTGGAGLPDLPRREPYRTWWGSLIVVAAILVLVGTLVLVDDHTSGAEPIAPGTTIEVGQGVTYVPADGWSLIREGTTPGSRSQVAGQGATFSVNVGEWDGTAAAEVERTKRSITADRSIRLTGDESSFHSAGGLTGVALSYAGPHLRGRAWVVVDERADLSVVAYGPSAVETYQRTAGQVDEMLDSVRMTGARP